MPEPERLLLSTVGTSDYEQTRFSFPDGAEARATLAPEALLNLREFDTVLLAHTTAVREETGYLDRICEVADHHETDVALVEIPLVTDQESVDRILDRVGTRLADSMAGSVALDITHAFRSLQLALYTAVVHRAAVGAVEFEAIYYAENAGEGGTAPVVDLSYLYDMMEWHHALWDFSAEGTLGPLADLLENRRNRIYRNGSKRPEVADLSSAVTSVSSRLDAGLPLEAGIAARDALEKLDALEDEAFVGPEGSFLEPLADRLCRFATEQDVDSKAELALTKSELERQCEVVQFYAETGREWVAIECAREMFLNRVLFERHGSDVDWLDPETRREQGHSLGAASVEYRSRNRSPPEALKAWDILSQYRNMHAHAGFKSDEAPSRERVERLISEVCDSLSETENWTRLVDEL